MLASSHDPTCVSPCLSHIFKTSGFAKPEHSAILTGDGQLNILDFCADQLSDHPFHHQDLNREIGYSNDCTGGEGLVKSLCLTKSLHFGEGQHDVDILVKVRARGCSCFVLSLLFDFDLT